MDSVLELPFIHDEVKNILYKYAVKDQEGLLSLLAQYDYPNIKKDIISSFCEHIRTEFPTFGGGRTHPSGIAPILAGTGHKHRFGKGAM